jgi:hypothetical protein
MAGDDKRDDQLQATKTKLDTIVSHLDAMKTLITGLQKEVNAGDLHGHARCAPIRGGNDSYSTPPFTIPPYNGKYDPAAYIDWELAVEQKFSYHDIPAISRVRLRIGIDLRDQANLAPARWVTIGSWFSDCIGASSLARCSRIVRVASHQIEVISTHRKIGNFASIKWYQSQVDR